MMIITILKIMMMTIITMQLIMVIIFIIITITIMIMIVLKQESARLRLGMDCWGVGAVSGLLNLQTSTPPGCQSLVHRIVATLVLSVAFTPKRKGNQMNIYKMEYRKYKRKTRGYEYWLGQPEQTLFVIITLLNLVMLQ